MFLKKGRQRNETFGIIGLGRFGSALALELVERGMEIMVIDWKEEQVKQFRQYTENAFVIQVMDKEALLETGIQNCDVVIVCLGEKMDISILTTLYLNSLGVTKIIAKANTMEHGEILEKLGAEVVYPERDMAIRLARQLVPSRIISYLELNEKLEVSQVKLPENYIGKSIMQSNIRKKYGVNIIAVEHGGDFFKEVDPEYVFSKDDSVVVIGSQESIHNFEEQ